jgi:FtsZ-binding cell division protein ZapB
MDQHQLFVELSELREDNESLREESKAFRQNFEVVSNVFV